MTSYQIAKTKVKKKNICTNQKTSSSPKRKLSLMEYPLPKPKKKLKYQKKETITKTLHEKNTLPEKNNGSDVDEDVDTSSDREVNAHKTE